MIGLDGESETEHIVYMKGGDEAALTENQMNTTAALFVVTVSSRNGICTREMEFNTLAEAQAELADWTKDGWNGWITDVEAENDRIARAMVERMNSKKIGRAFSKLMA